MISKAVAAVNAKPSPATSNNNTVAPQNQPETASTSTSPENPTTQSKRPSIAQAATAKVDAKTAPDPSSKTQAADQKAIEAMARKLKGKIDGRDVEWTEEEAVSWAQKGMHATKTWEEAAKMRKQAEQFMGMLRDPARLRSVLEQTGYTKEQLRKMAEDTLAAELSYEMLTPEQKRIRELEQIVEQQRKADTEAEERSQQEKRSNLEKHWLQTYDQEIAQTLNKSGLPRNPRTVDRMSKYMELAIKNDLTHVTWEDVAKYVKRDYVSDLRDMLQQSPAELLDEVLEADIAKKLRNKELEKLKDPNKPGSITRREGQKAPQQRASNPQDRKFIPKQQWKDRMERIKMGLE